MESLLEFCRRLPKVELHAHLNGSISPASLIKLIERHRERIAKAGGNEDEVYEWTKCIEKGCGSSLKECFQLFDVIHKIVSDDESIALVAADVVREFADDGVVYLELRFTPRGNARTGMTKRSYVEAVLRGVDHGIVQASHHIHVRLILSIDRSHSAADALETVQLAMEYANPSTPHYTRVVGVDLSGNPYAGNLEQIVPILRMAKQSGLKLAVHLAEIANRPEEDRLLLSVAPDRIGHATHLLSTEDSLSFVLEHRIPIELCLTSNVKCQTVPSYSDHHLAFWLQRRHPISLCTDDKGVFGTSLSEEYYLAAQHFSLSKETLASLAASSAEQIFAEDDLRVGLRRSWSMYGTRFGNDWPNS